MYLCNEVIMEFLLFSGSSTQWWFFFCSWTTCLVWCRGIHQSTVSHIINTWANFLYTVLGAVGIWLDEEAVKASTPEVFQGYSVTQIILDCNEIQCQTPSSLLLQSEVFSTYKSHCMFKGLIRMAHHSAVNFVSSLCEGAISNKEILKQSGIVALLNLAMAIMVDKGFNCRRLCALQSPHTYLSV